MKKVILLFFSVLFIFTGCAKKPRLSAEEEYRIRQEKRMQRARQAREDRISSLPGLNSFELDELERSKKQNDLNPQPGSFVYSPKSKNLHSTDNVLENLNERDKKRVKEYRKSVKQKQKSGSSWVYGI